MILTFVRHGKTDWGKDKLITGWEDPGLNDDGRAKATAFAAKLDKGFDVIYASPLVRAAKTAEIFAAHLGVPVVSDTDLRERNFGSLAGKTWEQALVELGPDGHERDTRQEYDYQAFGGESAEQVRDRARCFVATVSRAPYQRPLVVSHAGYIRMMYHLYLNKEVAKIGHDELHTFEF